MSNRAKPADLELTDDEIREVIFNAIGFGFDPGEQQSVIADDLMNIAHDLLSKLRAPVSSIREAFELTYAADADDPACAADLFHFTNGWRARIMSQVRAPVADERAADTLAERFALALTPVAYTTKRGAVYRGKSTRVGSENLCTISQAVYEFRAALASAPVADVPLTHRCANCGAVFQGAGCPSCRLAAPVASAPVAEPGTMEEIHRQERERSPWVLPKDPTLPDSAPVAGEAKNYPGENVAERLDNMADDQPPGSQAQSDLYAAATIWRKHIAHRAAPQASEAVRTQVLAALESAQRFIRNGIEFGYIRMPDADTPDPAHRTPSLIDAAIRSLKTQADKDGGQQRAGDAVVAESLAHLRTLAEFGGTLEQAKSLAARGVQRCAALSATQAGQGERDA